MKTILTVLLTLFLISSLWAKEWVAEEELIKFTDESAIEEVARFTFTPATSLMFYGSKGKTSVIDFGGDEVIYSGDLPVSESAKIFFEAVWKRFSMCQKEGIR